MERSEICSLWIGLPWIYPNVNRFFIWLMSLIYVIEHHMIRTYRVTILFWPFHGVKKVEKIVKQTAIKKACDKKMDMIGNV